MSAFRDVYGIRVWVAVAGALLFTAALIAVIFWASAKDEADCKAKGGHIVSHTGTGTGVGSNGQVVVVTTNSSECVVPG